ncbi:MAG: sensor histidine kinase, partial [Caulobacteraceae bacterium]
MTRADTSRKPPSPAIRSRGPFALGWHVAWTMMVGVAAFAFTPGPAGGIPIGYALAAAATPGAAGLILGRGARAAHTGLLVLWTLGTGLAVALSGGLAGPLAVWILAPLAAASLGGLTRGLAEAAALVAGGAAVIVLAQASGRLPAATPPPWLAVFALGVFALALSSALVVALRRSADETLRSANAREEMSGILEAQPVLTLDLAADGAVRGAFGGFHDALSKQSLPANFIGLGEESRPLAEALEAARRVGAAEVSFSSAGAAGRWLAASLARRGEGLVAVVRDATDARDHEAALERAAGEAQAQNQGKSRFLANMSHELRTPLNAIVGFSDIMRGEMFGPLSPKYAEYAALIHESGGHLLDVINDVLDLSKVEAQRYELSRETFDAREAVSAA